MADLSSNMLRALNRQIKAEFGASYLYLSMAAWFENQNLRGMAKWMRQQAQEENGHAMRIFNYVIERGGRVTLDGIDKPKTTWTNAKTAFKDALAHEKRVTGMINALVDTATKEKDHATNVFLQWFVTEQVEEEASVSEVVDRFELVGDAKNMLFLMDMELGKRSGE